MKELRREFDAIALPLMDTLYNGALRLTRNSEKAGDLLQETYLRAYRSFSQFERGTNCKAWLFTIMYSIFVNEYRKNQRAPQIIPLQDMEQSLPSVAESSIDGLDGVADEALNRLPEEFKLAVILVDLEECSYEEAASIMDCPVGTVRSRLNRARKILYQELQEYAKSLGYGKETQ